MPINLFFKNSDITGDIIGMRISEHVISENITRLCLYNCSLHTVPVFKNFPNLQHVDLSLNKIRHLLDSKEWGSCLNTIESLQLCFNEFSSFEHGPHFAKLKQVDFSWNKLSDLNLVLSQLRRHMPLAADISGKNNPWYRPNKIRKRFIAAFRNAKTIDGEEVSDEERTAASKLISAASLSNIENTTKLLVVHARTDNFHPQVISLGARCRQIVGNSLAFPDPPHDFHNLHWMETITTLVLDEIGLTKMIGIDRLKNLKWASFSDNFITSLHGIESCHALIELVLDNNAITHAEMLCDLSALQTLSLNNNRILNINWKNAKKLTSLTYLSANGNLIKSPDGAQSLPVLQHLFLANNRIENIREIFLLKFADSLISLDLFGNQVCAMTNYRSSVIYHLQHVKILDSLPVENAEANMARDYFGGKLSEDFVLDRLRMGPGADLSKIVELDLPSCNLFTIDIPATSLPNVRSLNLEKNNLSSIGSLIHSKSLKILCVNNNRIESLVPPVKGKPSGFVPKSKVDTGLNAQTNTYNESEANQVILPSLEILYIA